MPDWTSTMQQTFEYYTVDPGTWKDVKLLDNVKSCTISRDSEAETLGSATINITESIGESYIRVYLITIQNGIKEKHPLGTFLVQTPSSSFDGKIRDVTMDAYTPLLELKENQPPIGYSIKKGPYIMKTAYKIIREDENARAPVVKVDDDKKLDDNFVSNTNDSWLTFIKDLIALAKYELALDEMGRVLFTPEQETASLQPVWTFDDGNSSILYPEISMNHDLYGIPNIIEVIYSTSKKGTMYASAENHDKNSPTSIENRGRKIIHRITNPNISTNPKQSELNIYAKRILREMSTLEYMITFTHGYCPVRLGDCVRLNYSRAGITDIKAKVISQNIKCEPGCPVTTKAIFTKKLWG